MAANERVGDQQELRNGVEETCDDCNKRATTKLTEPAKTGFSYGYYCNSCLEDAVDKLKTLTI